MGQRQRQDQYASPGQHGRLVITRARVSGSIDCTVAIVNACMCDIDHERIKIMRVDVFAIFVHVNFFGDELYLNMALVPAQARDTPRPPSRIYTYRIVQSQTAHIQPRKKNQTNKLKTNSGVKYGAISCLNCSSSNSRHLEFINRRC